MIVYLFMCIYIYIYIYIYTDMRTSLMIWSAARGSSSPEECYLLCIYIYIYIHVYLHLMYVCSIYMYLSLSLYVYIYICICTHLRRTDGLEAEELGGVQHVFRAVRTLRQSTN